MDLQTAVAFFAHTRPESDIADVVRILCGLAAISHALGRQHERDDSIDSAAQLIVHCGRHSVRLTLPARS